MPNTKTKTYFIYIIFKNVHRLSVRMNKQRLISQEINDKDTLGTEHQQTANNHN